MIATRRDRREKREWRKLTHMPTNLEGMAARAGCTAEGNGGLNERMREMILIESPELAGGNADTLFERQQQQLIELAKDSGLTVLRQTQVDEPHSESRDDAEEEDLEGIDLNDELYAAAPMRSRRMISFDWKAGFVSPFVPSPGACAEAILTRAGISAGSVVVDLGSGDGVFLVAAARRGAHAIGYELSQELNETAQRLARVAGVGDNVETRAEDLTLVDVPAVLRAHTACATPRVEPPSCLLVMYLLPEFLLKIAPRVQGWLEDSDPNFWVATVRWPLPGRTAENECDGLSEGYYLYR